MIFQYLDLKGRQFLELCDIDNNLIEPSYAKGGTWLKHFSHSNSLYARATRAITNHAPIGKYRLKSFSQEDLSCPYGTYPIETRQHILHECKRHSEYWNSRRDSLSHFILFLEFNPNVFAFANVDT